MNVTLRRLFIIFPTLFIFSGIFAQTNTSFDKSETKTKPTYNLTEKGLVKTRIVDGEEESFTIFKPDIVFKGKYEVETHNGNQRFTIRNSRIGFSGAVVPKVQYKFLLELSNNGNFSVLDMYVRFNPTDRWSLTFGQQSVPLFNSYTISPNALDFANRPFIGKFFNSSRDIGFNVSYKIKKEGYPIAAEAGIYNGDGINKAKWSKSHAYGARVLFGSDKKGFRSTAKVLRIKTADTAKFVIWGTDVRYVKDNFKIEAEVMGKYNLYDDSHLFAYYVQSFYNFPTRNSSWLTGIEPGFRWDEMGQNIAYDGFGVSRFTAGVNFNLKTAPFNAVLRIDYEWYFNHYDMIQFKEEVENSDKLTIELMFSF